MRTLIGLSLGFLFLPACTTAPGDGGQQGEETAKCTAMSSTALAHDEASALGFSPDDVLAFSSGAMSSTLTWAKGGTTDLSLNVTPGSTYAFVHYEYQDSGSGLAVAEIGCEDQVEIPATVTFATADGAFDESWSLTLAAQTADAVFASQTLDLAALGGTYAVTTEVDPSAYDGLNAWADLTFAASGPTGDVSGQATKVESETASATAFDIASW
jgi:hypothetical protein